MASPSSPSPSATQEDEDEGLAQLISIFDDAEFTVSFLLSALSAARGNVARAVEAILLKPTITTTTTTTTTGSLPRKRKQRPPAISDFFQRDATAKKTRPSASSSLQAALAQPDGPGRDPSSQASAAAQSAWDVLGKSSGTDDPNVATKPIQLTLENLSSHDVPCELFLDALPDHLANALLSRLLHEAETWRARRFVLFDRGTVRTLGGSSQSLSLVISRVRIIHPAVESPHTTSFYTVDAASKDDTTPADDDFHYGGKRETDVRSLFPEMIAAQRIIEDKVNERMDARDQGNRHFAELRGRWHPNMVVANCYRGHTEGVGAHTDKLTYIGPRPTIGSLTLGAARPFRLRRLPRPGGLPGQTYNLTLPHNSLLIMLPPMQEEYRHEVPKCNVRQLTRHPISGDVRINLTYRVAREEYRRNVPTCRCGNPTELRTVLKQAATLGRYFYMCAGGGNEDRAVPAGFNCGTFQWLDVKEKVRLAAAVKEEASEAMPLSAEVTSASQ
ncbi:hypothetical protein HKX48_002224 [Thoreauomyces humboldtii]|nr:hypothetical protein HKX48_002224 [Thoreauomyces humboldtii]